MRWNCPHCGSGLAVKDEKVSAAWSFSRCYKCGGFALVRRSDINLIKVDRAPPGEPVLLPEEHESPTTLLSKTAADNLARYTGGSAKGPSTGETTTVLIAPADNRKPVVRRATPRAARSGDTTQSIAPQFAHDSQLEPTKILSAPATAALSELHAQTQEYTPEPTALLRASARIRARAQDLPKGPGPIASAVQSFDRDGGFQAEPRSAYRPDYRPERANSLPEPLPPEPVQTLGQKLAPAAILGAGLLIIVSGIYLYIQGQTLWEKARQHASEAAAESVEPGPDTPIAAIGKEIVAPPSAAAEPSAVIHGAARAIEEPASGAAPAAAAAISPPGTVPALPSLASLQAAAAPLGKAETLDDEVHSNAMAPSRQDQQIQVELLTNTAHIHSGPGMKYPVIGTINNHRKYAVEEWRDRWFKISLEGPEAVKPAPKKSARSARAAPKAAPKVAWIRNDLVRRSP